MFIILGWRKDVVNQYLELARHYDITVVVEECNYRDVTETFHKQRKHRLPPLVQESPMFASSTLPSALWKQVTANTDHTSMVELVSRY